jgi:hypothetical protein
VEPAIGTTESAASFYGAIQSTSETLVEDFSDRQPGTILEFMRRATARARAITAELTGARQAGKTTLPMNKLVGRSNPQSRPAWRESE